MYHSGLNFYLTVKGRPIDEYEHNDKTYVEGRDGSEYEIVLQNNSSFRRKVIFSVDGLNVMTGDATWERGYVIDAGKIMSLPGWRIDNSNVAKFVFGSVKDSYNQHNDAGDKNNIGVIGAMIFNEVQQISLVSYPNHLGVDCSINSTPHVYQGASNQQYGKYTTTASYNMNIQNSTVTAKGPPMPPMPEGSPTYDSFQHDSHLGVPAMNSLGTGWGDQSTFKTKTVYYNFNKTPFHVFTLYYDNKRGLQRRGINVRNKISSQPDPQAFPGFMRDGCPFPK